MVQLTTMGGRRAAAIALIMICTTVVSRKLEKALLYPHNEGEWVAGWTRAIEPQYFALAFYSTTLMTIFFARKEWPFAYALVYILPIITFYSSNRGTYWNVPWLIFVIFPIMEQVVGPDESNPTSAEARVLNADVRFKWVTWIWVPIQIAFILWACFISSQWVLPWYHWLGFTIACGINTGVLGINIAHELIHKNNWLEQTLGKILLVSVCYGHFFVEHIQGHHRFVSTDLDPATSHYGENFYSFWPRSVKGSFISAWHLETIRLEKAKLPTWSIHNQMIQFVAGSTLMALAIGALWGFASVMMFFGQSLVAFTLLEIVNYIEHYGLTRRQLGSDSSSTSPRGAAPGAAMDQATAIREKIHFEAVTPRHSWNSDTRITNLFLFKLQRHSDHHAYASRRYQILRSFAEAPQMPTGYAGMLVMALFPPIWFRVMNPRVLSYRTAEAVRLAALAATQSAEVRAEAKVAAINAGTWRHAALMDEDLEGESDSLAKTKAQYEADRDTKNKAL